MSRFTGAGVTPEELAAGVLTSELTVEGPVVVVSPGTLRVGSSDGAALELVSTGGGPWNGALRFLAPGVGGAFGSPFATLDGTVGLSDFAVNLATSSGFYGAAGLELYADASATPTRVRLTAGTAVLQVSNGAAGAAVAVTGALTVSSTLRVGANGNAELIQRSSGSARFGYAGAGNGTDYGFAQDAALGAFIAGSSWQVRVSNGLRVNVGTGHELYDAAGGTARILVLNNSEIQLYRSQSAGRVLNVQRLRDGTQGDWGYAQLLIDGQSPGNVVAGLAMNVNGFAPQIYAFTLNGNTLSLRDAANSAYTAMFGSSFTNPSSRTIKRDIRSLERGGELERVRRARPVRFRPAGELLTMDTHAVGGPRHRPHLCGIDCAGSPAAPCELVLEHQAERLGLIAEEVLELWPEACRTDRMTDTLGIDYAALIAPAFAAIAQLADRLEALEARTRP